MGRAPCCDKDGLKKGPWAPEEDLKLVAYIQKHGYGNWRTLPKNAGLQRCGKSCRLRWTNYLRPDIKRGKFSLEEEDMIIQLHSMLGNKWSVIAARLPGRTDNEIKNYWNTRIRKKLLHMGIDPVTHRPRLDLLELSSILKTPLHSTSWTGHLSSLSGVQNLVDPEILRLAASVMSPRLETDPQCLSDQRFQHNQHHQQLIQDQLQTAIHGVPPCVPLWSDEASLRVMEQKVEEYRDPSTGYGNGYYYVPELNHATLNPSQENRISSVLSATTSSSSMPGNSDSPCIIGSGSPDDEKESYCSNLLNYETIPDLLDMDLCNGMQQLIGDSELLRPWNIQLC